MTASLSYITQGRVEADHATLSPRRTTRLLLTDPAHLKEEQAALRDKLSAACPEMTALATQVSDFAALLTPAPGNPGRLNAWIARTRAADLPFLHSFATSLERDRAAVGAALTLPWHNGRTEGVNHKIKLFKRQTYGRAGFRSSASASCSADAPPNPAITSYENPGRPTPLAVPK